VAAVLERRTVVEQTAGTGNEPAAALAGNGRRCGRSGLRRLRGLVQLLEIRLPLGFPLLAAALLLFFEPAEVCSDPSRGPPNA
jgi:hypothetical protein